LVIFHRRYGSFGVRDVGNSVVKFLGASIALAVVTYATIHWPGFYGGKMAQKVVALAVTIAAATATYFGVARVLHTRELAELRVVRSKEHDESTVG